VAASFNHLNMEPCHIDKKVVGVFVRFHAPLPSDFDWVAKANYNGTPFFIKIIKVGIVLLKIPTQICISKR
jgi:hypothetical protein